MMRRFRFGMTSLAAIVVASAPLPAQTSAAQPLLLNHLYIVIDSATYHDIVTSPFILNEFAGVEMRTTAPSGGPRSSIYLYGHHTYLEIVGPGGYPGARVGDVGIALGFERPGGISQLARRLGLLGAPFDTLTRVRVDSTGSTPWFQQLRAGGADSTSDRVALWAMEYTLAMTERIAKRDLFGTEDRMRDRFIADHYDTLRLMGDVTGATMAVPAADIVKMRQVLGEWGISVFPEGEGAVVQIPGFTLHLLAAWERPGIRRITLSLTHEAAGDPTYRFGKQLGQLRFGPGRKAVWDFSLP